MQSYLHLSVASAPRYQRLRLNSLRRGTEGDQITGIVSPSWERCLQDSTWVTANDVLAVFRKTVLFHAFLLLRVGGSLKGEG